MDKRLNRVDVELEAGLAASDRAELLTRRSPRVERLRSIFSPAELAYLAELPMDERAEIERQRESEVAAANMACGMVRF